MDDPRQILVSGDADQPLDDDDLNDDGAWFPPGPTFLEQFRRPLTEGDWEEIIREFVAGCDEVLAQMARDAQDGSAGEQ